MMCTMRHWERTPSTGSHHGSSSHRRHNNNHSNAIANDPRHVGPELLLQPVADILDNRDITPVRNRQQRVRHAQVSPETTTTTPTVAPTPEPARKVTYSLPLSEIMIVERQSATVKVPTYKLQITTIHQGYFEFDLRNRNRHDTLLAFLQAHLPAERILTPLPCDASVHSTASSSKQSTMDVDRLHAQNIKGLAEAETWPEKISRRVSKVVTTIQTMSGTLCDLACCHETTVGSSSPSLYESKHQQHMEVRDLPPVNSWNMADGHHLEMADEFSTVHARSRKGHAKRGASSTASSSSSWRDDDPALFHIAL
jgi:hypothetical protein